MLAKRIAPTLGAKYAAVVEFVSQPTVNGLRVVAIERDGVLFGALHCHLAASARVWYAATNTGAEAVFEGSLAFHSAMLWAERECDKAARAEQAKPAPALVS